MRFLLQSFVSRSFLVLLRLSFLIFFFHLRFILVTTSKIHKYLWFYFSPNFLIFSWFGSSILSIICCLFLFPLFITSMVHAFMINSILEFWLYILIAFISVFNHFFIFCKELDVFQVYTMNNRPWFCKFVVSNANPEYFIRWYHCYYKGSWRNHFSLEDTS